MSSRKKQPAVIPVIGARSGDGSSPRQDEIEKWEREAEQRRSREAGGPQPVPAQVPAAAPSAPPAAPDGADAARREETPGYLPMPEFTEPSSQDPGERLEYYSQGILAAQYAARANHERAEQQKLIALGLRLRALKEEELHKQAGFDTFGEMTEARFGIKKHQANNIIRCLGVVRALEDLTTQELKERPLRVLVPVLDKHGPPAVRKTWVEASRHGSVTEAALREAANFLGFGPPKEIAPEAARDGERSGGAGSGGEWLRAVERIRSLAERDPARALREAEELESAARELLEELSGSLER